MRTPIWWMRDTSQQSAIHCKLVNKMEVTLKKANTVNIRKSLHAKYTWVYKMVNVPAEFLIFTCVCVFFEWISNVMYGKLIYPPLPGPIERWIRYLLLWLTKNVQPIKAQHPSQPISDW
jgi:hypothetical protein